ncbi:aminodeoxychorismate/anthranilate synthase component II [Lujinxingia vulgaris]|uniref:Aminodeoxychorismate/anthranilate synthase component II n=1 Tax=Lujinxingia vulgaris TaxID=2600176 RepID=A0A5C6X7E1_9DELT|nr:aminodeoxychorismate/anthranilate synthase component II [Lujinxingia vulgaris]TXD37754.1 aminodeoxychorismate/anthranilate synthase component II [Lujinxingia vulgaris]
MGWTRRDPNDWAIRGPGQVVLLDNRDSFVYNLADRLARAGVMPAVVRSDAISLSDLLEARPSALVVSPGPGHPRDAGISEAAIEALSGEVPILGVCLGHQAIARVFGTPVVRSEKPRHGMASAITHDGSGIFKGMDEVLPMARYHSLVARAPVRAPLVANAHTDAFVMGVRHETHPTHGVQFHPESILSPAGLGMLRNFLAMIPA